MTWNILKMFKKDQHKPYPPIYSPIAPENIPEGSVLIFMRENGNEWTQKAGEQLYNFPFHAPFHAAPVVDAGRIINVGLTTKVKMFSDLTTSTTRIDVVTYPKMTQEQVKASTALAYKSVGEFYDVGGFLNFGTRYIVPLKYLIHPSAKRPFCSELCAETHFNVEYPISNNAPKLTAPWDLYTWAWQHEEDGLAKVWTAFVGKDFGK
jgi:hypothetical protein